MGVGEGGAPASSARPSRAWWEDVALLVYAEWGQRALTLG